MRTHRQIITMLIAGAFAGSAFAAVPAFQAEDVGAMNGAPMQLAASDPDAKLGPVNPHHEVGKVEEVTPAPAREADPKLGTTQPGEIAETGTEPAPSQEPRVCLGDTEPHEKVASIKRTC